MTGFEPRTSGIGSDRSTNWATTTAQLLALGYAIQRCQTDFCLKANVYNFRFIKNKKIHSLYVEYRLLDLPAGSHLIKLLKHHFLLVRQHLSWQYNKRSTILNYDVRVIVTTKLNLLQPKSHKVQLFIERYNIAHWSLGDYR